MDRRYEIHTPVRVKCKIKSGLFLALYIALDGFDKAAGKTCHALYFAGDNNLCGFAVCRRTEGFHRLDLDDGFGRSGFVDEPDALGSGLLDLEDSLGFALGLKDLLLLLRVGAENSGFLFALGF